MGSVVNLKAVWGVTDANFSKINHLSPSQNTSSSKKKDGTLLKNEIKTFVQQIIIKLDNSNYLSWKQHIEGIIQIHKLQRHLANPSTPPRYLFVEDHAYDAENPTYLT